jgi:hypothetical protein
VTGQNDETDAPRCEGLAPFHCGNPTCPVHAEPVTVGVLREALETAEAWSLLAAFEGCDPASGVGLHRGPRAVVLFIYPPGSTTGGDPR